METEHREPWNTGKLGGQKAPLKSKDIWAVRIHLRNTHQVPGLAMFNLAIDSKLRGCDLVNLRVRDVTHGSQILSRAMVVQRKTQRPVLRKYSIKPMRARVNIRDASRPAPSGRTRTFVRPDDAGVSH